MEREVGPLRARLLAGLRGRVLEIGPGNGPTFPHYPATVTEVVAVEPEPYLRRHAQAAAARAPVPVEVRAGVAGALPAGDGEFDAAVTCGVLCSVPDQAAALAELRRVLRPGGELRFLEHVRAPGGAKARVQRALDATRLWPALAGGCRCARDTVAAIRAAGFRVADLEQTAVGAAWLPANPQVLGVAHRDGG
ncbi:MAG: class I SAM-dependent methyltransferase [Solirubrobacteraceae bacterium]|nr:class I SAM-dependent methyltransferase [Solirubrobacteraceae bacterium]